MFNETSYLEGIALTERRGGLGESKESIIARGCAKVSKGVFQCPDGSRVTPTESAEWGASSSGTLVRSDSTPNHCLPGESWVGAPVNQCMKAGVATAGGGGTGAGPMD